MQHGWFAVYLTKVYTGQLIKPFVLQTAFYLFNFKCFYYIAGFQIVVIFDGKTALHAAGYFLHVVFVTFQRSQFCTVSFATGIHHNTFPDKSDFRVAENFTIQNLATGNGYPGD